MRILILILSLAALGLGIYNFLNIDFNDPMEGESMVALIGVVSCACAFTLLTIFYISKQIQLNLKRRKD